MSWGKARLGDICTIEKGITGIQKAISGEYPMVVTSEERKSHNEYQFDTEAVIIPLVSSTGHGSKTLNRIHYQTGKFALGSILCAVIPKNKEVLNTEYLYRFLDLNKENELVSRMKGMANVSLPMKEIAKIQIPIPPIYYQKEFVEKYRDLGNYCSSLSGEYKHQTELITKIRQQILNEAVQGKLVPQDPNDKPADELLSRIKAVKEKLILEKKLRIGKATGQSLSLIKYYKTPHRWKWCKADDIFFITKLAGFEYTEHIKFKDTGEIPVVRAQNVRPLEIDKKNLLYIDRETSLLLDRCSLTKKCLLVTFIGAGIGDVATFNENNRWHLAPNVAKLEPFKGCEDFINLKYVNYFLMSKTGQTEIYKHVKATAQPSLSMGTIRDIDIPIPPLAEQQRIVARIDQLMSVYIELEQNIQQNQQYTQQLMQVALKEALSE